ncbi:DUF935 family protein [Citrobacter braakii]|uniref:phage portal protein family protein n=1 Tax=Citrobacter braakii TaxID=57706 RepID=UPI0035263AE3
MGLILDMYGRPFYTEELREQQTSHTVGLKNLIAEHPSHRLTPGRLISILNEAETGNLTRQADLFSDMEEKDAHIFAEMQKRKRALLTIDYEVLPPLNATPKERANAQYLQELLTELDGFEDLLIDMLDAIGQGFSNTEIKWKLYGKEWHPAEFNYRPQSWFTLDPNDQDRLLLRNNSGAGDKLQPFGWISHRHKSRSGYVARAGLLRTLAWPYLYRVSGTDALAEMLEIYGIPIRIGKYPSGTGKSEKAQLMRAVTEIGRYAGGIIPEEMQIELQQAAAGTHAPHLAIVEWAERSVSKAVLGGTLTTQADGKTSTNALGKIHNEVRDDLLISDGKQTAITLRADLFYPLIVLNRDAAADPRRIPRLRFITDNDEEQDAATRKNKYVWGRKKNKKADNDKSFQVIAALVRAAENTANDDGVLNGLVSVINEKMESGKPSESLRVFLNHIIEMAKNADSESDIKEALSSLLKYSAKNDEFDTEVFTDYLVAQLVGFFAVE